MLLLPQGGAKDYLWLAVGEVQPPLTIFFGPTGYSAPIVKDFLGSAYRNRNAASENPPWFTASGTTAWVAFTIAVSPVEPSPPPSPSEEPSPSIEPSPSTEPSPTSSNFRYLYKVEDAGFQSFTLWAMLEDPDDSQIYDKPGAKCPRVPPLPEFKFCIGL